MPLLYGALRPFSDESLKEIHLASLTILEKAGALIDHPLVLVHLAKAGYRVDFDQHRVWFPSDKVEQLLFNFRGNLNRQPKRETLSVSVDCGSQRIYEYATGRPRPVRMRDLIDVPRLSDALEHIDEAGTFGDGSRHARPVD